MSCIGDCLDLGPPPDSILFLPPPPVPSFLQQSLPDLLLNTTPCSAAQICELTSAPNRLPESGDYMELPRKDVETWTGIGDTWLLVLVVSSIGVLLLGALLAMFLLKCRDIESILVHMVCLCWCSTHISCLKALLTCKIYRYQSDDRSRRMNMFGGNDCSLHRQMKNHERECSGVPTLNGTKMILPADAVLYHGTNLQDNRMVWATLTPRGTQHFISENYPPDLIGYGEEDHYETIDNFGAVVPPVPPYPKALEKSSFDNSGFLDYEYEDPTPLIEGYQLNNVDPDSPHYQMIGNTDMRCSSLNAVRRHAPIARPKVSSPTRIEHPNLPPLNMYPHKGTLKKNGTLGYRAVESSTLPKYGL